MKVLIACEYSGVVRRAFRDLGVEAWSCDIIPSDDHSKYHIQSDVLDILNDGWDLMIGHPPCQYLCNSGVRWLYNKDKSRNEERWQKMREGAEFFLKLWNAPIEHICLENSIMHGHAKEIIGFEQSQTIQPWMHGHGETKATCLWLKNLPLLQETNRVEGRKPACHYASPGPDRWKIRSKTYEGIGCAMAIQWTSFIHSTVSA